MGISIIIGVSVTHDAPIPRDFCVFLTLLLLQGKGSMKTFWMDGHSVSESDSALVTMRALLVEDKAAMARLSEAALTHGRRPRSSSRRASEEKKGPRTVLPPLSGPTPPRK